MRGIDPFEGVGDQWGDVLSEDPDAFGPRVHRSDSKPCPTCAATVFDVWRTVVEPDPTDDKIQTPDVRVACPNCTRITTTYGKKPAEDLIGRYDQITGSFKPVGSR